MYLNISNTLDLVNAEETAGDMRRDYCCASMVSCCWWRACGDTILDFSKRLIISFLTSFWSLSKAAGMIEGEPLKRSSIPEVDWVLPSIGLAGAVFSAVEVCSANWKPAHALSSAEAASA